MNLTLGSSCKHINAKGHVGVIESSNESRGTVRDPRDDRGGIPQPHGFFFMGKQESYEGSLFPSGAFSDLRTQC